MFDFKMKPERLLKMLKGFGINPETLIPQLERVILTEAIKLEQEAGAPLKAIIGLNGEKTHLIVSLYKDAGGNNLSLWRSYPLSNITELLNNITNAGNTAIATPERAALGSPEAADTTDSSSTEPTTSAADDTTAE